MIRRARLFVFVILVLGLVLSAASAVPQGGRPDPTRGFFPVSVWYAGGKARAPMLETVTPASRDAWRKDIAQIKRLGFNTVRTWVEWTACEKTEGAYDFSALELLADLAGEAGLRVIIQVYIDSAPDWVGARYPDSKFVSSNGVTVESQASPGFCFDHPGVRGKILGFFQAAARAVKGKPAFYGWDLWSEPHIINWAEVYYVGDLKSVQFCYCPSTQARFRDWLKAKYGTIEALNTAWYRTLRAWDEVEPPRFGTILTFTDYIDWKAFIADKLAEDLALKARAVKSVLPDAVVTSHSAAPGIFTRPDWSGTPDDRKMADSVDFYGASIYPKHAWTIRPWSPTYRSSGLDFVRSMGIANGGFYIGELQAGYGVFGMKMSQPVVAADTRDWMWSTVAYGARAVNIYAYFPMSTGYEAGGYGLVELDGKVTERAEAGGRIAKVITDNMDLFLKAQPAGADIAILYNPLAHMIGGQQAYTGEGQTVGVNSLSESLQGVHRAYFERNIPVDFLHVRDLGTPRAAGYKLLIAPYPVMMSLPHVEALVDYVRAGGTLVTEARCGWVDEKGFSSPVIPGGGLHEVLGCREVELTPLPKTGAIEIKAADEAIPLLKPGDRLDGLFFEEGFDVFGAKSRVLAAFGDGRPAIVAAPFGKGRAVIVGSFLGSAYHHFQNPANGRFFAGLADWVGAGRAVEVSSPDPGALIESRVLVGPGYRLLFGFNRGETAARSSFALPALGKTTAARDLETGAAAVVRLSGGKAILEKTLGPREAWIVVLESKS
ncbi:MAG: beta-galactosidase [Candidatus Aminicenantes bacterium]|nr:beta-galactosidase [Candidatus Aminicenantes bacterium]